MASRHHRIGLLQVLLLVLPIACAVGAGAYVWHRHLAAQQKLAELEPRYARLEGLLQAQGDIEGLRQAAGQSLARFAYPADRNPSDVASEAQQAIRAVMTEARLDVQSIQVQPAREGKTFDRIAVALRMEGEMASLQAALARLLAQSPAVFVDSVTVNLSGPARPAASPKLSIQLNLSVLRTRAS